MLRHGPSGRRSQTERPCAWASFGTDSICFFKSQVIDSFFRHCLRRSASHSRSPSLNWRIGTEKDASKGILWVTRAAENGSSYACYLLGLCYERGGAGFKQDDAEAVKWYKKMPSCRLKSTRAWAVEHAAEFVRKHA